MIEKSNIQELIKENHKKRQTVKSYSNKKINQSDWELILDTIYWSPSSHGFEPYRVLIIEKENNIRKQLKDLMWNQVIAEESDKLIFFISLKRETFTNKEWVYNRSLRKFKEIANKKGQDAINYANKMTEIVLKKHLETDEPDGDSWSMKQCYIALGMAMSTASLLNIGTTAIEGMEKTKIIKLFKKYELINDDENIAVALAFGYPSSNIAYAHRGNGKRIRDKKDDKFKTI
ncbi:MAG: nitroreductase family protein [Mycoplasmatales bacterium]|nr:nitroreductase family protein [Mycoplasmatales bacterium]